MEVQEVAISPIAQRAHRIYIEALRRGAGEAMASAMAQMYVERAHRGDA